MPEWLPVLLAAEQWGQPPWAIEEQATGEWWERWRLYRDELAIVEKSKSEKNG